MFNIRQLVREFLPFHLVLGFRHRACVQVQVAESAQCFFNVPLPTLEDITFANAAWLCEHIGLFLLHHFFQARNGYTQLCSEPTFDGTYRKFFRCEDDLKHGEHERCNLQVARVLVRASSVPALRTGVDRRSGAIRSDLSRRRGHIAPAVAALQQPREQVHVLPRSESPCEFAVHRKRLLYALELGAVDNGRVVVVNGDPFALVPLLERILFIVNVVLVATDVEWIGEYLVDGRCGPLRSSSGRYAQVVQTLCDAERGVHILVHIVDLLNRLRFFLAEPELRAVPFVSKRYLAAVPLSIVRP